jgi:hypothetical protein
VVPAAWSLVTDGLLPNAKALAFDPVNRRLLVVDRERGYAIEVETVPAAISSPVPLDPTTLFGGAAYAYDSRRRQVMIHNGIIGSTHSGNFYRNRTDFFRASSDPLFVDPGVTNAGSTSRRGSIAVYDPIRDRMVLLNGEVLGIWTLQFDESTPARLDLVEAEVAGNGIRVRFAGEGASGEVRVERSSGSDWIDVGAAYEVTPGLYEFRDGDVVRDVAYRYRGRWFDGHEARTTAESAPVVVGGTPARGIALRVRDGSIARSGPLAFACRLPAPGEGALELVDVRGRIVARTTIRGEAGREVEVTLVPGTGPGLYFARLRQGSAVATARLVRL